LHSAPRTDIMGLVQRLLAILIAGTIATTSVAAAEACPTMRAQALKRCCCPPSPQEHARLTCCNATKTNDSRVAVRDRHEQPQVLAAVADAPWSFVSLVPSLFIAAPPHALAASAAGPPLLARRI
jgi:hypothetical protein